MILNVIRLDSQKIKSKRNEIGYIVWYLLLALLQTFYKSEKTYPLLVNISPWDCDFYLGHRRMIFNLYNWIINNINRRAVEHFR